MVDILARTVPKTTPSVMPVAEIAAREKLSYIEAVDRLKRRGHILAHDPREHLNPVRVREFSRMTPEELLRRYGQVLENGLRHARSRDAKVRYAAALKHHRAQTGKGLTPGQVARSQEKVALHLAIASPGDRTAREALEISAGLSDQIQRNRARIGFDGRTPTIARAARIQGRSWIEVRDDLARYGLLSRKDPRRKITEAEIKTEKPSISRVGKSLSAEKIELAAMTRASRDPDDKRARRWFAAAGAMETGQRSRTSGLLRTKPQKPRGFDLEI